MSAQTTRAEKTHREPASGDEHRARTTCLADTGLSPEAEATATATKLSLIEEAEQRATSVFLGREDCNEIAHDFSLTVGYLMLECFPPLVHELGGQVAFSVHIDRHLIGNAVHRTVSVSGDTRRFLLQGLLFACLPDERVVISADDSPHMDSRFILGVRSSGDPGQFWERWRRYCHEHNYLRGQAFFADGEIIERKREYTWDDILLSDSVRRTIQTHVGGFLAHRRRLKALGVKARRGLILAGPPGTGKTLLGKVLADTLDCSFLWVSPRHVRGADSFEDILSLARMVSPAVIFLEDLDLFAEDRDHRGGSALGELMNQLDGAVDNEDLITIATTNRLDVIEAALRNRPGRFDRIVRIEEMDAASRREMLQKRLMNAHIAPPDMEYLVEATDGYTGAQLEELSNTLYILAVQSDNAEADDQPDRGEAVTVDLHLIDLALNDAGIELKRKLGFHVA